MTSIIGSPFWFLLVHFQPFVTSSLRMLVTLFYCWYSSKWLFVVAMHVYRLQTGWVVSLFSKPNTHLQTSPKSWSYNHKDKKYHSHSKCPINDALACLLHLKLHASLIGFTNYSFFIHLFSIIWMSFGIACNSHVPYGTSEF